MFLLSWSLAVLSASLVASKQQVPNGASPEHYVDVVIVGAGASGMAAASSLFRHSNLTVVILEGRNYTGGRVHARQFGITSNSVVIEEGANWVHGEPPPGGKSRMENPAWKLAEQVHLAMTRIPGSCANTSGYSVYTSDGRLYSKLGGEAQKRSDAAFQCANVTGQRLKAHEDMSFAKALQQCGFAPPSVGSTEDTLFWELTAANLPLDIDLESLKWALPDPTYMYFGPDDHFVHEQRPRGYATVLDAMLDDDEKVAQRWKESLNLDAVVEEIAATPEKCRQSHHGGQELQQQQQQQVLVRTKDGREFCSRYVISTLPLGVMQKDHSTIFQSPPLTPLKIKGQNAFDMGNFTKFFLQFEHNFWSSRGQQWLVANRDDEGNGSSSSSSSRGNTTRRRNPMEFHDLSTMVKGSNTIFTYVTGSDCDMWSEMTDQEARAKLVELLQQHFPNTTIPKVTSFYMTRHYADVFMRGAYSVSKVGVTNEDFNAMVEPHGPDGSIFFAGEHTCAAFQGYVHGGILTGNRAAAEVLLAEGNEAEAGKAYDWSCETLQVNHTAARFNPLSVQGAGRSQLLPMRQISWGVNLGYLDDASLYAPALEALARNNGTGPFKLRAMGPFLHGAQPWPNATVTTIATLLGQDPRFELTLSHSDFPFAVPSGFASDPSKFGVAAADTLGPTKLADTVRYTNRASSTPELWARKDYKAVLVEFLAELDRRGIGSRVTHEMGNEPNALNYFWGNGSQWAAVAATQASVLPAASSWCCGFASELCGGSVLANASRGFYAFAAGGRGVLALPARLSFHVYLQTFSANTSYPGIARFFGVEALNGAAITEWNMYSGGQPGGVKEKEINSPVLVARLAQLLVFTYTYNISAVFHFNLMDHPHTRTGILGLFDVNGVPKESFRSLTLIRELVSSGYTAVLEDNGGGNDNDETGTGLILVRSSGGRLLAVAQHNSTAFAVPRGSKVVQCSPEGGFNGKTLNKDEWCLLETTTITSRNNASDKYDK